jgi:hypothetical protein
MNKSSKMVLGFLAMGAFIGAVMFGTAAMGDAYRPEVPTVRVCASDSSRSETKEDKARHREELGKFAVGLVDGRDILRTYLFASEVWEGPSHIPNSAKQFASSLEAADEAWLKDHPGEHRITRPGRLFDRISIDVARISREDVRIEIITHWDGGDEDLDRVEQDRLARAIASLAADRRLARVIVFGVKPGAMSYVRDTLNPFHEKVQVFQTDSKVKP